MPPRKSDSAVPCKSNIDEITISIPAADESQMSIATEKKDNAKDHKDAVTIEDLTLPKSIITRLAKGVLPPNTQIQANAILALSKSATVFINYLASHANEHTVNANKKTIAPADVFKALDDVEFSFLKEPLEAEFTKFNQIQTEKRTNYRQKIKTKADGDDAEMADTTIADTTIASERDAAPRAKKARLDGAPIEEDAETEEEDVHEDNEEGEEEEEEEEEVQASGDETQDVLEDRVVQDDGDEALDGDESD